MIGKKIQGYEIVGTVGSGAMGAVYKAKDPHLPRFVAVKVMNRNLVNDPIFVERFRLEANALAMVQNPHVIAVHTLIDTDEDLAIVMEFVDGQSLQEMSRSQQLSTDRVLRLIRQVLVGLGATHKAGILHRDIKPSNILVTEDDLVKLVDFGLAKASSLDLNLTQTGTQAGTLLYMSPEQVEGFSNVGPQSDLYSVGMTLYKLVCGRLPFSNPASTYSVLREIVECDFPAADEFNPELPQPLVQFISRSVEKRPESRFESAGEMIEGLDAVLVARSVATTTLPVKEDRPEETVLSNPGANVREEDSDRTAIATSDPGENEAPVARPATVSRDPVAERASARPKRAGLWAGIGVLITAVIALGWWMSSRELPSPAGTSKPATTQTGADVPGAVVPSREIPTSTTAEGTVAIDGEDTERVPGDQSALESGTGSEAESDLPDLPNSEEVSNSGDVGQEEEASTLQPIPGVPPSRISVTSRPSGARVYLDGAPFGLTPIEGAEVDGENITLRLVLEGYQSIETSLTQVDGVWPSPEFDLVPVVKVVATTVSLRVIPRGRVFLNGESVSGSNFQSGSFDIVPGRTEIRVQSEDYGDWTKSIRVSEGRAVRMDVDFTKLIPISVTSKTPAGKFVSGKIFVDGQYQGSETPKLIRVRVGNRVIEVQKDGYTSEPVHLLIDGPLDSPLRILLQPR